ncbi:amidohydrolase family protein [Phytohabitans sp. ZYX-F-186]|uniref:Amidohydrolase family protein n=1 Tax=Phytohabitans maris TaxID=3071409 RepID=A0ABU0ZP02_9ACTN|nr:amidohydrolase family protein [Phytohabitans sp. ZYX-F-186]MDQ7907657.1 amidohydrolase family protein [Phytohabitans sp. ZYX-F-186]
MLAGQGRELAGGGERERGDGGGDRALQSRAGDQALFHQYTPEDVYWGEFGGALENLAAGTTTVVDTSQCSYTPDHTDAALDGIRRSGIRSVFSFSPVFGDHEPDPRYAHPEDIRRLVAAGASSGIMRLALGYHVDEDLFRLARELDIPVFAHVNDENWGRVLEDFETGGLLGPDITFIHCLGLADTSWNSIERTGGKVSVSCIAEQTLAMGRPAPSRRHLTTGSRWASALTPSASPRSTSSPRCARPTPCNAARSTRPPALPPPEPVSSRDVLHMATLGGARAAHLDHLVGSLTPGKRADIVVLNARALNSWPSCTRPALCCAWTPATSRPCWSTAGSSRRAADWPASMSTACSMSWRSPPRACSGAPAPTRSCLPPAAPVEPAATRRRFRSG